MNEEAILQLESTIACSTETAEKADALNQLAFQIRNSDTTRSIQLSKEAFALSALLDYPDGQATALTNEAFCYVQITDYERALEKAMEARYLFEQTHNERGMAQANYTLCMVYFRFSDFSNGLDSITKSAEYYRKIDDRPELMRCHFQMGFLYHSLNDAPTAIDYFNQSIDLSRELNNRAGEAAAIMGLGQVHLELKEYDKSRGYLVESLAIREQIGDWRGYGAALNAYLTLCLETEQFEEAERIAAKGIQLAEQLDDKMGVARVLVDLGRMYLELQKTDKAKETLQKALAIAESINLKLATAPSHFGLSKISQLQGDFEQALYHFQQYHKVKEETLSTNAAMKARSVQFIGKIETAQKEAEINRLKNVELKNAFEEIEEKNREITSSITYALRIQTAILPPYKTVQLHLPDSFILYRPKDIVAGDFYWMETVNDLVLFAACDCTGHGVPGAMVSVVCHNALNRAVREFGLTKPAAILDKTAEIVKETFSQSEENIKDGMDISLCAWNPENKTLEWAGANNPLWIIRNDELMEIKANKQPIGNHYSYEAFTNHAIGLQKDDTIYLFTDGFADQFGGETGQKKLTKKGFRNLLLSLQHFSIQEQHDALGEFYAAYRREVEQIDDMLVIGVRF